ncbi:MAG: SDR family oxidoreductase [Acidiferrobacterales bacterium]|nr:SDR family oxidoreductase [Acidiferrobacterales bacterium]
MRIDGSAALVTGSASGMGEATARLLAQHGAKVGLLDIDGDRISEIADEIGGLAVACDVTDADSMAGAIASAGESHGVARILINCAGIAPARRIVGRDGAMPLEDFRRVIDVNLIGTFNAMRLMATAVRNEPPLDEIGERGVIINVASVSAFEGQIGQAAYSASKGAIVALTIQAARELASAGIRVMTIAPGMIATPLLFGMPEEVQQSLANQVPFPKRLGDPGEFARLVEHILENQLLNGEVIRLDGAIRMQPR